MIISLNIKNIAIIDEAKIKFDKGFNVLTGETGAGKSIIIDAINSLLGARADKTLIKKNKDFAEVSGTFQIEKSDKVEEIFKIINQEFDNIVQLSRNMSILGKNECKINGEPVNLSIFKKLTNILINIFGQHDQLILLDIKNHIQLLDDFCIEGLDKLKAILNKNLLKLSEINLKISQLGGNEEERQKAIDLLKFEINQIESANLSYEEFTNLQKEKIMLQNAEKIFESLNFVCDILSGQTDVCNLLKSCINELGNICEYNEDFSQNKNKLEDIRFELVDISDSLKEILSNTSYSENELNKVEERLQYIQDLKRKFGSTINDIITYLNNAKDKLFFLENCTEKLEELKKEKSEILAFIYKDCVNLTTYRLQQSKNFENFLINQLVELGIKNAQFKVNFLNSYSLENIENIVTQNGADCIEFLFSANLGEELKPISKIISGGELSRFMLALKCISNSGKNITYIFDEIDNGIGGNTGSVVAKKLAKISKLNQVLCITHLAQIAVFADCNIKVEKQELNNQTKTNLTILNNEQKIEEISRMIGIMENKNFAILHAIELINEANTQKLKL